MKKIKLSIFTILILFVCTTVNALTIQQKWVQEEAPISGDFLSYQRLFTIGNDVIAIGNYGGDGGHNIIRYDTNGNKLWSTETDYYTDFRLNGESLEALYSYGNSSGISIIDSYDENGKITNEYNEILDDGFKIILAGEETYKIAYSRTGTSGTKNRYLVKLYKLDQNFNSVEEYEFYLSQECHNFLSYVYNPNDNEIIFIFDAWGDSSGNRSIFSFDIDNGEFSEEYIYTTHRPYGINEYYLTDYGLVFTYEGEYKSAEDDWSYVYEKTKILLSKNHDINYTISNYFNLKGVYYKDGFFYISGNDDDGAVLYKLNDDLELVWTYRKDSSEKFSTLKNMVVLNDYIFILSDTSEPNGYIYHSPSLSNRETSVMVLDNKWNLVMEYALDSEELKGSEIHNIIESDDGFIVAGEIYDEENDANAVIAEFTVIFNITTKTDGNGTITPSTTTEHSGNEVTFVVTPNEGYVLSEVQVTDENGNVIIFTDYKFTMPSANVLIEATFVKEEKNPETSDIIIVTITISILSGVILTFVNHKKNDVI